jgi:hypothetical protein
MVRPTLLVELQKADGTWVDVSAYVSMVDGVSFTRGRSDEDSQPDAGSCGVTFEALDGRFTHGDATYDCRVGQPILVSVGVAASSALGWDPADTWPAGEGWPWSAGPLVRRFFGYVDSWPTTWDDPFGTLVSTTVEAFDDFARASRRPLGSMVTETILQGSPSAYYPLSEEEGATSAGDTSGNGVGPLVKVAGTVTFGGGTGPTDGQTSVLLGAGGVLRRQGGTFGNVAGDHALGCFYAGTVAGDTLVRAYTRNMAVIELGIGGTGKAVATIISAYSTTPLVQVVSPSAVNDGLVHRIDVIYTATSGDYALWVDGASVATAAGGTGANTTAAALTTLDVGEDTNLGPSSVSHVTVGLVDPANVFDVHEASSGFSGDLSTDRAVRLWQFYAPTSMPAAAGGRTLLRQEPVEGSSSVVEAIQSVMTSEGGVAFIKPFPAPGPKEPLLKVLTFADLVQAATTAVTPIPGDLVAVPTVTVDGKDILNDVTGSRFGGAEQRVTDATSVESHGTYAGGLPELMVSDGEVLDRLHWEVQTNKDPRPRLTSLAVDVQSADTYQAQQVAGLDVGSRLQVSLLPATSPVGTTADLIVQGWTETLGRDQWTWEATTSAASDLQVWLLDNATWGVLGTAKLGY